MTLLKKCTGNIPLPTECTMDNDPNELDLSGFEIPIQVIHGPYNMVYIIFAVSEHIPTLKYVPHLKYGLTIVPIFE